MIYYFSGTGNSAFVAESLGRILDEETVRLPAHHAEISGERVIFVCPVYAWGVPPVVMSFIAMQSEEWIREASKKEIWAVFVCGDEVAMAPEMLFSALKRRSLMLKGVFSAIAPNNYVLLPGFDVDDKAIEVGKLRSLPKRIEDIASKIKSGIGQIDVVRGSFPRLKTRLVYPLFCKWGISPSKWEAGEECVGCGKCIHVCPNDNIRLVEGKPAWGRDCTSCLACYHVCPEHAVRYGRITSRKGQYFFAKSKIHDAHS